MQLSPSLSLLYLAVGLSSSKRLGSARLRVLWLRVPAWWSLGPLKPRICFSTRGFECFHLRSRWCIGGPNPRGVERPKPRHTPQREGSPTPPCQGGWGHCRSCLYPWGAVGLIHYPPERCSLRLITPESSFWVLPQPDSSRTLTLELQITHLVCSPLARSPKQFKESRIGWFHITILISQLRPAWHGSSTLNSPSKNT